MPGHAPFIVRDVPPLGYKTITHLDEPQEKAAGEANVLENEFFKLTFDPAHGAIQSLVDKRTGRQWVDAVGRVWVGPVSQRAVRHRPGQ